jgi:NAD(P)H-hydrate epimerase
MDWRKILINRKPDIHKGDCGHVFAIGASPGLSGALCLAAQASLKIGAGLVTVGVPKELEPIFEIKLTEVMSLALPSKKGVLDSASFSRIKDFSLRRKTAVLAVGPGISSASAVQSLIGKIVTQIDLPIVLDADGINALAKNMALLKRSRHKLILTPHLGEFSRLIKKPVGRIAGNRKRLAKEFALRYNLVLVLKGHKTIVTDGKSFFENTTGNPGMATAGSGDVLTGMIAGLLAQIPREPKALFQAAKLGVYLHGLAGDLAVKEKTQAGLIAGDMIEKLPLAI